MPSPASKREAFAREREVFGRERTERSACCGKRRMQRELAELRGVLLDMKLREQEKHKITHALCHEHGECVW